MELTGALVAEAAAEYRDEEPLYPVEREHLDIFPEMVATGEYGWRDVEWVVRWYYRRTLGEYPHGDRQARERAFARNDFETVREVLAAVDPAATPEAAVDRLTDLDGVDVPVASAFCMFLAPQSAIVLGDREWAVLERAGELDAPYPDPPSAADYRRYLDACRTVADRADCDCWTVYTALWRLWKTHVAP